jgi:hypothetical protein
MFVVRGLRARRARRISMFSCRALVAPLLSISLVALSSYACDDGNTTRIGPSTLQTNTIGTQARFVSRLDSVQNEITAVAVPAAFCPFASPLLAPVSVVMRGDGRSDLQLREMQLQFVDTAGVRGAFRTINGPELTSLFGSTIIPAFGTRTFPVSLPFGCVGGQTGTLFVDVFALNSDGRQDVSSLRVHVR